MFKYLALCLLIVLQKQAAAAEENCPLGEICINDQNEKLCTSCETGAKCTADISSTGSIGNFYCMKEQCIKERETCAAEKRALSPIGICCNGLDCNEGKCQSSSTSTSNDCKTASGKVPDASC